MAGLHRSYSVWSLIIYNMHSSKDNQQSCNFFLFHLESLINNAEPGEALANLNSTWGKLNLYPQCIGQSISQIMNLTTKRDSPDMQPQEIFWLLMSTAFILRHEASPPAIYLVIAEKKPILTNDRKVFISMNLYICNWWDSPRHQERTIFDISLDFLMHWT